MSVRLHVLSGGTLRTGKGLFTPGRDEGVRIATPVACYLIRHPQAVALFDAGGQPDVATDPFKAWRRSAAEIRRWQARGALVVFGRDPGQWATLKKGPDAYD